MRTEFSRVFLTPHDEVALITLNHPESMNAASVELLSGLYEAISHIDHPSSGFRAAVITGEGRGFCSGANLTQVEGITPAIGSALEAFVHPVLRGMRNCRIPLVSAVNGAAAGVGMSLALSCDIIVASRSAYFLQAFTRIGLVPDGSSTWLLPRLIGLARAKELSMLAERLPAEKALEWGLINRVSDDAALLVDALALASKLAKGPTLALGMTKTLYNESAKNSFEDQIDLEQRLQSKAFSSEDFPEGVIAFHEKRPANFKGR